MRGRASGVLLHISSLPGAFGVGDFGPLARTFADFLAASGFSVWQLLPLTPVSGIFGNSPYSSPSVFAGNVLFVSPELLKRDGLITDEDIRPFTKDPKQEADYEFAARVRESLLAAAWRNFCAESDKFAAMGEEFAKFLADESFWLNDYALFSVLKKRLGDVCWNEWPDEYKYRSADALDSFALTQENAEDISFVSFCQFIFFRQWRELREYCRGKGISILGDMPMFVALDSPDVWAHREQFDLDGDCRPKNVAGVPPDYFSKTGQRWGNPLYLWDEMERGGFAWWLGRMKSALAMYDIVRVDHFRGFCGCWAIPASEETAINGAWRPAPGRALFERFREELAAQDGTLPLVAEDLGVITDDVRELMEAFGLPGMKVLQFAFGDGIADNPYILHNIERNSVVYTGTHDNNTSRGWWRDDTCSKDRMRFRAYVGCDVEERDAPVQMTRLALASTARLAVIPVQDILALDASCRMNTPGLCCGNWKWRLTVEEFVKFAGHGSLISQKLKGLNDLFGRARGI